MKIAVVIPCYKVGNQIDGVLAAVPGFIGTIYVVDDACPEQSGIKAAAKSTDQRVKLLQRPINGGVGAAVVTGYQRALEDQIDVVVKLDGDGQMDPALIPELIDPLLRCKADYVKGNRFYNVHTLQQMPVVRLIGNSALSFINKAVNGYWNIMDPTNGFTAIHRTALKKLPLDQIDPRYFFESDMLFRLGIIRAVVRDMPMDATYGDEKSNLRISRVLFEFPPKYLKRFLKRMFYNYLLRDFNVASVQWLVGIPAFLFGVVFGLYRWAESIETDRVNSVGTVMLAALPIIIGFQLILQALHFDVLNIPSEPLNQPGFDVRNTDNPS